MNQHLPLASRFSCRALFAAFIPCFLSLASCALVATPAKAPAVTQTDFLQSNQAWGQLRRDRSVADNPLMIAGKSYASGLGTHATSMIPITVPADATVLTGACGIDDGCGGPGLVEFAILSGTSVLWSSGEMKAGDAAKPFRIDLGKARHKRLYLHAYAGKDNSHDHADWVDLAWSGTSQAPAPTDGTTVIDATQYGLKPGSTEDMAPALQRALTAARSTPGKAVTVRLPKGTYHFDNDKALRFHVHVSNHDQPDLHPVGVPLVDLHDVTLDGQGSSFIFRGRMMPVAIMDSTNVTLKGISIDFAIPHIAQAKVTKADASSRTIEMTIDEKLYPHDLVGNRLVFKGKDWSGAVSGWGVMVFRKDRRIAPGGDDLGPGSVERIAPGRYLGKNWPQVIQEGDVLALRHCSRPHPAILVYRAANTSIVDVPIHNAEGMGILAQRSEDILVKGGGSRLREGTDRYFTTNADATHYSNCRGHIESVGGLYEGMMDDAINVHATCLQIVEKPAPDRIKCRYKHDQAVGFEVVMPGERIQFISAPTLEVAAPRKVKAVTRLSTTELLLELESPLPDAIGVGDAIENADWFPSVRFAKNIVRNNRARGSLFTTPRPVVVEDNFFDYSSGSALLLAGDANGWFESGSCNDVLIRRNHFRNNLTSTYQFTEALIAIYPEIPRLGQQKAYYHRNVRIEDNVFETFDVPLLFAISTQGIKFNNNKIAYNNDFPSWKQPAFRFKRCDAIEIKGNTVSRKPFDIKDCRLELTPGSAVKF